VDRETGALLLAWFDAEKRDLPWRRTRDPYAIWVSEAMLQQTQVATVIPFYERWMERFPTLDTLARANTDDVLELWQGLGYYRRCRYLLEGARHIAEVGLPNSAAEWRRVPGVGAYTSAAIASIALGEPAPLVDGNVERVYARLTADPSSGAELTKAAWKWAADILWTERPGDWNQALMELGATVCRPAAPQCDRCPIAPGCSAYLAGQVDCFPTRAPKQTPVELQHRMWIPLSGDLFGIRQVPPGQWWEGMWEFPRADVTGEREDDLSEWVRAENLSYLGSIRHVVTKHRIRLEVYQATVVDRSDRLRWVSAEELSQTALPAPQRKALALLTKATKQAALPELG
jgi:A/G-specific adenine glycosylase